MASDQTHTLLSHAQLATWPSVNVCAPVGKDVVRVAPGRAGVSAGRWRKGVNGREVCGGGGVEVGE